MKLNVTSTRSHHGYLWRGATESERQTGAPLVVLDIDPQAAPSMIEAFARVASGTSVRQVTAWLRDLPEQERAGRTLQNTVVRYLLSAPVYVARPDQGSADVLARPKTRWTALVPDDVWLQTQRYIADHAHHHHQATGRYLLVGYIRCPLCGRRVVGNSDKGGSRYRCAATSHGDGSCVWGVRVGTLDRLVLHEVTQLVARALAHVVDRAAWDAVIRPTGLVEVREKRLASLRAGLATARGRILRATRLYVDGAIDQAGYVMFRDDAQRQIAAAESEIARLGESEPPSTFELDAAITGLQNWADMLADPDTTTSERRTILNGLVAAIDVERIPPTIGRVKGRYTVALHWTPLGLELRSRARVLAAG